MGAVAKHSSSVQVGLASLRYVLESLPHQPITCLMSKEKTKCYRIPFGSMWTKKWRQNQNKFESWFCPEAPITAEEFPLEIQEARTCFALSDSPGQQEEIKGRSKWLVLIFGSPVSVKEGITPNILASHQSRKCIPLQLQYYRQLISSFINTNSNTVLLPASS